MLNVRQGSKADIGDGTGSRHSSYARRPDAANVRNEWKADINSLSLTQRRKLSEALMRKPLLLAIGLSALIGAGWLLTDARTRLTLFQPNGFIQSGSALGVAVGDTRLNAQRELLRQGMALRETTNGGTCFYRAVKPDRQLDLFFVQSWHGGMICVVSRDERVEELIWAFQPISL